MIPQALVSIVVPTYNRADILIETLNSILKQSYKKIEIIVVSDGSTDDTSKRLKQFDNDERVRFIQLAQNSGLPAKVRNEAISVARGEYIAFCDDDDLWHEQKLERQIHRMISKKADISSTAVDFFDENGAAVPDKGYRLRMIMARMCSSGLKPTLYFTNFLVNSSVVLSKEVVERIGLLNESRDLRATEDYEYWLRIIGQGCKYTFLNEALIKYRIHASQITTNDAKAAWYRSILALKSLKEIRNGFFLKLATLYAKYRIKRLGNN